MRLIDADMADRLVGSDEFRKQLDMMPTEDAEPVVHAHWHDGQCTHCGAGVPTDTIDDFLSELDCEYCWSCGAKMDEEENDV